MGIPWRPERDAGFPSWFMKWLARFDPWARDKDRLEKCLETEIGSTSASSSIALNRVQLVNQSRVTGGGGSLNPLDVTGSLIPDTHNAYDIGQNSPPMRWRNVWVEGNLDVNTNADIAGTLTIGNTLTSGSGVFNDLTVAGDASIGQTLTVSGNASVGNTLTVSGTIRQSTGSAVFGVGSGLRVDGATTTINGTLSVTGAASVGVLGGVFSSQSTSEFLNDASFLGGVTVLGGFTCHGQAGFLAGITATGGVTFNSLTSMLSGFSTTGNAQVTGASWSFSGCTLEPSTTNTGALGRAARRWANIFGSTGNITNFTSTAATISGLTVVANATVDTLAVVSTFSLGGNIAGSWIPDSDQIYGLGAAGQGWGSLWVSGVAHMAKSADSASGTTTTLDGRGNYFDITGTSTVAGLSHSVSGTTETGPGFTAGDIAILQLDSNPLFTHNATRLKLLGGVTFSGATGDFIGFISEGSNNYREMFRSRADGMLRVPTDGTNRPAGTGVLVAGVTTISTNKVTTNSMIFLTGQNSSGTAGELTISSRTAGASFDISSTSATDTRTVAWCIIEPEQ